MENSVHGHILIPRRIKGEHVTSEVGLNPKALEKVPREIRVTLDVIDLIVRGETLAILLVVEEDPEDLVLHERLLKAVFVADPLRDVIMHHCAISF